MGTQRRGIAVTVVTFWLLTGVGFAQSVCPPTFAPAAHYVGEFNYYSPYFITAGDLNGDGWPEALVTVAGLGVVVFWNNGPGGGGTLGAHSTYFNGYSDCGSVAIGDFNADGRADMVAASNDSVAVFLALPPPALPGTFASRVHYNVGAYVTTVVAADVNGDGRSDIITDGVNVLLANANGTFQPAVHYEASGDRVVVSDLNNDGRPDIATGSVNVLLAGGPPGSFLAPVNYPVNTLPLAIVAADFNTDGRVDLFVMTTNWQGVRNNVNVLLATPPPASANGTFLPPQVFSSGYSALTLSAGDINGDGVTDLVSCTIWRQSFFCLPFDTGSVNVMLASRSGDATFRSPLAFSAGTYVSNCNETIDYRPTAVVVADFNRDGRPDLAVATEDSQGGSPNAGVSILLNTSTQPVGITTQPVNRTNAGGTNATFSVTAVGTPPLSYQWRRNGVNLVNSGTISGATASTLTYSVPASDASAMFDCLVTNACGAVASSPAVLNVAGISPAAPIITQHPAARVAQAGSPVSFAVAGINFAGASFQWRRNGSLVIADGGRYSGATTATLTISPTSIAQDNASAYECTITNAWGSTRSNSGPLAVVVRCSADFNQSGVVSVQDIFDFLAAWFTACP